ncbi:hypothetical protein BOW25_12060, partial [Solemya velum gill symbiont]
MSQTITQKIFEGDTLMQIIRVRHLLGVALATGVFALAAGSASAAWWDDDGYNDHRWNNDWYNDGYGRGYGR